MVSGLLLGALVTGIGWFAWQESSRSLEVLRAQCEAAYAVEEREAASASADIEKRDNKIKDILNQLLSDKNFLALSSFDREMVIDAVRSGNGPSIYKLNGAVDPERVTRILKAEGLMVTVPSENPYPQKINPSDWIPLEPVYDCGLQNPDFAPKGAIGQKINDELSRRDRGWNNTETAAVSIVLLLSAPRVWYFLLDRLAEISAAIRGVRS
jgi:hypothetical protein